MIRLYTMDMSAHSRHDEPEMGAEQLQMDTVVKQQILTAELSLRALQFASFVLYRKISQLALVLCCLPPNRNK